ncbi:MAG: TRAP transporter substrate-binding protein [Spirochaetales bacterium]|jgi:tripartite ATP-independent transporter DctP family solute receptor|nr:TRAP transporter substrate-binding protein [Spirochaetales bacterium]
MKKICLVLFAMALAGLPLWAGGSGEAGGAAATGPVNMTFGSSQPPKGGFMGEMAFKFADYLKEESKGAITVTVHHSGALSNNERELLEMAQAGTADFAMGATTYILGWSPSMKVFDLPFLFESVDHFRKVTRGPVGKIMEDECAQHGVILLGQILPGFRSIFTASKPIKTIDDLRGMKIRSMESPVYIEMFKALGMLPTPMPSSELYTALQTGVVDAGENDPASVVSWGWIDVIKYYMLDQHTISSNIVVMNKPKYDGLSPDLQKAVRSASVRAVDYQLDYIVGAWDDCLKQIRAKGVTVVELSSLAPFQDRVKFMADQYDKEIGKGVVGMVRDAAKK